MRALFSLVIIVLLASCKFNAEEKELPGHYIYHAGNYKKDDPDDKLELNANGTYRRLLRRNGTMWSDTGTWKLVSSGREVHFYNWPLEGLAMEIRGVWNSHIKFERGKIQLVVASDVNHYYRKLD